MKISKIFHINRLSLLLRGLAVLLILSSALFSSTALASSVADADSVTESYVPTTLQAQGLNGVNQSLLAVSSPVYLCASDGSITMPDSTVITVWSFVDIGALGSCTTGLVNDSNFPGPVIQATDGDTVTIYLTNALSVNTSILIAGQDVTAAGVVAPGLFTSEVAPGDIGEYSFTAKEGTYLYESGTDPSIQIPMGLYGALVVDSATSGMAYGHTFDQQEVLLLSEIDPNLNADPVSYAGGFELLDYQPTYWLINGKAYPDTAGISANPGEKVLLRYLNAGFDHYSMAILGGYQTVIAKDGYEVPNTFDATAEIVPAGSTAEMIVDTVGLTGKLALYNRNMYVTNGDAFPGGMLTFIELGPPVDQPPLVNAGIDQTVNILSGANLDGTVNDDGLSGLSTQWTQTSGPIGGTATFGDNSLVDTTASFNVAGSYVLRLTATDGTGSVFDEVTITAAVDQPPIVDAGVDDEITLPADATLDGTVTDDGLSALGTLWTMSSGPGVVTFGGDTLVDTTASFSVDGVYVLRLTATDGNGPFFDEVTITVNPAPIDQPPTVDAGLDQEITLPASANLDGTVTDDGLSTLTTEWTQTSGPGAATFGDGSLVDTTASFSVDGVYVLRLTATDGNGPFFDEVTITVNPSPITNIHIGDLDGSSAPGGGPNWTGTVTITVHDSSESPVAGATVTIQSTRTRKSNGSLVNGTLTCVTNALGMCSVSQSVNSSQFENTITFTVTNVTDTAPYQPGANHDPDVVDSDGTTIIVAGP